MPSIKQTRHAVDAREYLEPIGLIHQIRYIRIDQHSIAGGSVLQWDPDNLTVVHPNIARFLNPSLLHALLDVRIHKRRS